MKDNGLMIVSIVGSLAVIGGIVYLIVNRRNRNLPRAADDEGDEGDESGNESSGENGGKGPVDSSERVG
jgi:hypothetical protein